MLRHHDLVSSLTLKRIEHHENAQELEEIKIHLNGTEQHARVTEAKLLQRMDENDRWRQAMLIAAQRTNLENTKKLDPTAWSRVELPTDSAAFHMLTERFLVDLAYEQRSARHQRISQAYLKTYEWIFEQPENENEWADFPQWLRGPESTYWMTGKPGSGKSTLMKFVHDDKRTMKYLSEWAAPNQPLVAGFFIWNSGTAIQMSQEGLLRSLLCDVLRRYRTLIPQLLPERWQTFTLLGIDTQELTVPELLSAFTRLGDPDCTTAVNARILFVIDGLDEFSGDHEMLIGLIRQVSRSPHIKCCVASRPWPVFKEAYGGEAQLLLENLTRADIMTFAINELQMNPYFKSLAEVNSEDAEALFNEVLRKAAGVFLWVVLVVKSLRSGLRDGDRIKNLQQRLERLPEDLEDLFTKITSSIEPEYQTEASHIFQIVRKFRNCGVYESAPTVLQLSLAEEDQPATALQEHLHASYTTPEGQAFTASQMTRRIQSRCKGLLEVPPGLNNQPSAPVEYLHRTVRVYFEKEEVWQSIKDLGNDGFDPALALCSLEVCSLKKLITESPDFMGLASPTVKVMAHASDIRAESGHVLVRLIQEFDRVMTLQYSKSRDYPSWLKNQTHWTDHLVPSSNGWGLTSIAVASCLTAYIKADIVFSTIEPKGGDTWSLLDMAVNMHFVDIGLKINRCLWKRRLEMVELLLTRGFDPNQECSGARREDNKAVTPYQRFLLAFSDAQRQVFLTKDQNLAAMKIVDLFLRYGADKTLPVPKLTDDGTYALRENPTAATLLTDSSSGGPKEGTDGVERSPETITKQAIAKEPVIANKPVIVEDKKRRRKSKKEWWRDLCFSLCSA